MRLAVVGVSHKTAPVAVRESLAFREEIIPAALAELKARRRRARGDDSLHLQPRRNHRHLRR